MVAKSGNVFNYLMTEGDPRTFSYFLSDPWIPLYTLIGYVILVTVIGPWYMKDRKPYTLKNTLLVYNAFQVVLSGYIAFNLAFDGWMWFPNWFICKPIEMETTPNFLQVVSMHHLYYLSKYTELLDTVFFVLRKKQNQITFLHVYHHCSMPLFTVFTLRFSPGSSISLAGFLNSTVHVIMYGYYLLAALGPRIQKYLWWKKYITLMQMAQFSILLMHFTIILFSSCNMPKAIALAMVLQVGINFLLFFFFYRRQYNKNAKAKALAEEKHLKDLNGTTNKHTLSENVKHRTLVSHFNNL